MYSPARWKSGQEGQWWGPQGGEPWRSEAGLGRGPGPAFGPGPVEGSSTTAHSRSAQGPFLGTEETRHQEMLLSTVQRRPLIGVCKGTQRSRPCAGASRRRLLEDPGINSSRACPSHSSQAAKPHHPPQQPPALQMPEPTQARTRHHPGCACLCHCPNQPASQLCLGLKGRAHALDTLCPTHLETISV